MKWKYFLFISAFTFNVSTFAMEQEEKLAGKRPSSTELDQPTKKKISFARPTADAVFKHVLQDDKALRSLIKAFLDISDITEIQRLDEFLNPIKPHGNVREVINCDAMKAVMEKPTAYVLYVMTDEGLKKCTDNKQHLINELSRVYEDIKELIPEMERDSRVDVMCKLQNQEYFMLEVQVTKQVEWDKRALYYAAHAYGAQLKRGRDWNKVVPVVAINILGKEGLHWWPEDAAPFRSYTVIDEYDNTKQIPYIKILQCSLNNLDLKEKKNIREELKKREGLLEWLEYFKCAHLKDSIPEGIDEGLKVAYEQSAIDSLPLKMRERYFKEEDQLKEFEKQIEENRKELINEGMQKGIEVGVQIGKEEGKREGREEGIREAKLEIAKNLKIGGMSIENISSTLKISIEDLQNWLA